MGGNLELSESTIAISPKHGCLTFPQNLREGQVSSFTLGGSSPAVLGPGWVGDGVGCFNKLSG
jgi:hypothetical protein